MRDELLGTSPAKNRRPAETTTVGQRALDDESPNIGGIFATAAHQYQSQFDRQVGFTLC
jgi:predicted secreted protein